MVRAAQVVKINVHETHFCEYLTPEVDRSRKTRQDLVGSWVEISFGKAR